MSEQQQQEYTTTQAGPLLGVKPPTVTRYIELGHIAAEKRGRDYFIKHEELERFNQSRRKAGRQLGSKGKRK
jgi:excisionase family DNA binding protein